MVVQEKPLTTLNDVTDLLSPSSGVDRGVYRVRDVAVHATGLALPSHMGLTADGRVLVSEYGAGRVRDITEPGDYIDQSMGQHAWNLRHPGGILPLADGRILVADSGSGRIYDITTPGAASAAAIMFEGVDHPYGLFEFRRRIFTSFSNDTMVGIAEVVPGECFTTEKHAYVSNFPVVVTAEPYRKLLGCGGHWTGGIKDDRLLLGHAALGAIFDVTPGGTFDELRNRRYAWGLTMPLGMTTDPLDGSVYVAERTTGVIKRIPHAGGYSRFAEPILAGFQEPSCARFTPDGTYMYVCDRSWDTVYRVELEHTS